MKGFYNQLQNIINKVDKQDILIIQGDWNAKVGGDAHDAWATHAPFCNNNTNERALHLLKFARLNNMTLSNTLGKHKLL